MTRLPSPDASPNHAKRKPLSRDTLQQARHTLYKKGYLVISDSDTEFGFDPRFRDQLLGNYFNNGKLEPESYYIYPPDRERARDVVRYYRNSKTLQLAEHDTVAINSRSYSSLKRDYPRVEVLKDLAFEDWIRIVLALIPTKDKHAAGTFGINFFRTFTDVVSGPHQDDEEFALIYVVNKQGGGGETSLYEKNSLDPFYSHTLKPGELIIFDDRRFLHGTSPLESTSDGSDTHRDVLVCTVNKPGTYPLGTS